MLKMKINKKAVMEDLLQLAAWLIVIVIVFFIFFGIKTSKEKGLVDKTEAYKTSIEGNYLLIDFLNQKTSNPDADTIAKLIALYYEKNEKALLNDIDINAKEFFSKSFIETKDTTWKLEINDGSVKKEINTNLFEKISDFLLHITSEYHVSSIVIPSKTGNPITINLYLMEFDPNLI